MKIISIRQNSEYKDIAIKYFQESWSTVLPILYQDSITNSINAENNLPQWYLLEKDDQIIGCAGLITNDFISRMDLYPWLCALFISETHRNNNYAQLLIEKAKMDAKNMGFKYLNLSTDHIGYYEKLGFTYIGQGYHPWEEESRIYQFKLYFNMDKKLNDYVKIYKEELKKGDIQIAYSGLVKYMSTLKTHFSNNVAQFSYGNVLQGYMDYTYFYFSNDYLRSKKLRFGIVLNHQEMRFELWLMGQNKETQTKYWEILKTTKWNETQVAKPQYSELEVVLIENPNFDDLEMLSLEIENRTLPFSKDILLFLKNIKA